MSDTIDARGLICPLPVLKLGKALREAVSGTTVTIWADDPVAVIDIPHFCTQAGHQLISQHDVEDYQIYTVKRTQKRRS